MKSYFSLTLEGLPLTYTLAAILNSGEGSQSLVF